jgi:tellurite resistance protein TehA-like permease
MGSGIISVGLLLDGFAALSVLLLVACAVSFVVLVVLTAWRLVAYRDAVVADLTDPRRGFGFLTFVAGANVLGVRLAMDGRHTLTAILLGVAGVTWLVLGYVIPWTAVLGSERRPVVATANGTWFIWVVASQSVATAAATIEPEFPSLRDLLAAAAVFSWSVGMFLYAAAGVFVSARMMLYRLRPTDLTPSYWVKYPATPSASAHAENYTSVVLAHACVPGGLGGVATIRRSIGRAGCES